MENLKTAEKLRSILKPIHWSLALKAALFGASWFFLPFWAFFLLALYLYFNPAFQSFKFALPFFTILFLATVESPNPWIAVFLAALFYLLLGTKDLVFINRGSSYEILVLLILFLTSVIFFRQFDSWQTAWAFPSAFLFGAIFFMLCRGLLKQTALVEGEKTYSSESLALGLVSLVVLQLTLILLFLPLNYLYQSALLFIATAVIFESVFEYIYREITRDRVIDGFSIFFVFLVIILGSARWGL